MKKINIFYWIATSLFAAFMLFSAIPNIMMDAQSIVFVSGKLGYPQYIIPFLGVAKAVGAIGLLIPGFPKLKEWAYAGLFFDLLGAVYSIVAVDGFDPSMVFMVLPFALFFASYFLYHKRMTTQESVSRGVAVSA